MVRKRHRFKPFACAALLGLIAAGARAQEIEIDEAITREVSVLIDGLSEPEDKEVLSREVSLFLWDTPADPVREAVSREASVVIEDGAAPAPVRELAIRISSDGTTVTLDWRAYDEIAQHDIVGYRVYRSDSYFTDLSDPGVELIAELPAETLLLVLTGQSPFEDWFYAVIPIDTEGSPVTVIFPRGAYQVIKEVITREASVVIGGADNIQPEAISREVALVISDGVPPAAISRIAVTVNATGSTVTLDWSAYDEVAQGDLSYYRIYISDAPITSLAGLEPSALVDAGTKTITFQGLPPGDHYFAVVPVDIGEMQPGDFKYAGAYPALPQAVSREVSIFLDGDRLDGTLSEAVSREASVVIADDSAPAPITYLNGPFTAETSQTRYAAVDLDWSAYDEVGQHDIAVYRVYRADEFFDDVDLATEVAVVPAETRCFTATGLVGLRVYYWAVAAEDVEGRMDKVVRSQSAQASVEAILPPQNIRVESLSTSLDYAWDPPPMDEWFLDHYEVRFDNGPLEILGKDATVYSRSALDPSSEHSLEIWSVGTLGEESGHVSRVDATILYNPQFLAAAPLVGGVRLSWRHDHPLYLIRNYSVYMKTTRFNDVTGMTPVSTTTGTSADVTGIPPGVLHYFAVTVTNVSGGEGKGVMVVAQVPLPPLALDRISADHATREGTGRVSIAVDGAGFEPTTEFWLEPTGGGAPIVPTGVVTVSSGRVEVSFDIAGAAAGTYDLVARQSDGSTERLSSAFEVLATSVGPRLDVRLEGTGYCRANRVTWLTLSYKNIGDEEMPAPLMRVLAASPGTAFRLAEEGEYQEELFLLGVHPGGVAGRLPPGGEGSLTVFVRTPECLTCEVPIELQLFTPPWGDFIGWDLVPQPAGMGPEAWEQVKGWIAQVYGDRWRDFHAGLAGIATRLSRRAGPVASVGEIFRFVARQALGRPTSAIAGRVWSIETGQALSGVSVIAAHASGPGTDSTAITHTDGAFAIDWLVPDTTYNVALIGHDVASTVYHYIEATVPEEGDLLGLALLAGPYPIELPTGCSNCDTTDLPEEPMAPPPSMFTARTGWTLSIGGSLDPNAKSGPLGKGEGKLIDPTGGKRIEYRVEFQNDPSAGAAAHTVTVTDTLSELLVPSSFMPTALLIADRDYSPGARTVVAGIPTWTNVFVVPQIIEGAGPGGSALEKSIGVRSTLTVDPASGLVTWELVSQVDPASLDGVLLPDDSRHQGAATFGLAVNLRPSSAAGQKVRNKAHAVFDDPKNFKDTNEWVNEIAYFTDPEPPRYPSVEFDYLIGGEPRRLVLEWDAASSEGTSYQVYVWLDGEERPATPAAVVNGSDGTYCVLPPDFPDGQYHWQVVADKGGSQVAGEVWDFTFVGGGAPPAAPTLRLPEDIESLHPVLSWEPAAGAQVYEVYLWRDGDPEPAEPTFPAVASTSLVATEALEPGTIYRWRVVAKNGNGERPSAIGSFGTPGAEVAFRRGDVDADELVNVTDVIATLVYLFLDGPRPGCVKAADANDDGRVDISDPIRTLFYIYLGDPIAPPGPEVCGTDDTEDDLDCWYFTPCMAP